MKTISRPPRHLILEILRDAIILPELSRKDLWRCMRAKFKNTLYQFPTSIDLWEEYRALVADGSLSKQPELERILRVKDVRTNSGIAPITVLTKPYPCPGKCVYCPTEARMPKSYISSEPAAARALSLKFDAYEQVVQRVETLERNGHESKKIELIVKGGTWSSYRWEYRLWFITRCYEAANDLKEGIGTEYEAREANAETPRVFQTRLKPQSETLSASSTETLSIEEITIALATAQRINETSAYRIIGLTIETRPDWVTAEEIIRLRQLGCTRVELGVQTLQDDVLELTQRGHTIEATIRATALLKQAGFKTDFHILPGQPGSTPEKDLEDFRQLFADSKYRPDMIKLYPCVVLPTAELHEWTKRGDFTPLEGNTLKELLISMQQLVPRYCRISRLIRDFPESDISYGNKITNLRETLETEMNKRGIHCQCLRCREVGHVKNIDPSKVTPQLFEETYDNAGGREIFITMEDPERRAVFAFLRLRLPNVHNNDSELTDPKFVRESEKITEAFPLFRTTAFVRELHTYGTALDLAQTHTNASQHKGYGRPLMQRAETIAHENGYPTLAVISGIGVREYYRSLGYTEQETYMVKKLV